MRAEEIGPKILRLMFLRPSRVRSTLPIAARRRVRSGGQRPEQAGIELGEDAGPRGAVLAAPGRNARGPWELPATPATGRAGSEARPNLGPDGLGSCGRLGRLLTSCLGPPRGPSHRSASARSGASHVVRRRAATLSSCLLRAVDHPAYKPNPGRSAATTSATPLRPAVGLGLRGAQPHTPAYGESAPCVRAEAGASRELLSASRRATARAFLLHRRKTDAEHFPSGGIRRAGDRESARFLERAESPDGLRPAETVDGDMGTQAVENLCTIATNPLSFMRASCSSSWAPSSSFSWASS